MVAFNVLTVVVVLGVAVAIVVLLGVALADTGDVGLGAVVVTVFGLALRDALP